MTGQHIKLQKDKHFRVLLSLRDDPCKPKRRPAEVVGVVSQVIPGKSVLPLPALPGCAGGKQRAAESASGLPVKRIATGQGASW